MIQLWMLLNVCEDIFEKIIWEETAYCVLCNRANDSNKKCVAQSQAQFWFTSKYFTAEFMNHKYFLLFSLHVYNIWLSYNRTEIIISRSTNKYFDYSVVFPSIILFFISSMNKHKKIFSSQTTINLTMFEERRLHCTKFQLHFHFESSFCLPFAYGGSRFV